MNYIPKHDWIRGFDGILRQGRKHEGILCCTKGVEINGELAIEIERMENHTQKINQMDSAETKATAPTFANVKVEITKDEPTPIKKKK